MTFFLWKIIVRCEMSNVKRALPQHIMLSETFHISRFTFVPIATTKIQRTVGASPLGDDTDS